MQDESPKVPEKTKNYIVLREAQPMQQPPKPTPQYQSPEETHSPGSPDRKDLSLRTTILWAVALLPVVVLLIIIAPVLAFFLDIYFNGLNFGRPFRVRRRAITAPVAPSESWTSALATGAENLDPAVRQALGAAWLADARAEHASVASFGRLSLELLAVGAPPQLLEAAHQAALDEIQHARLCFSLAASYERRPLGAGPFPEAAAADSRRWPRERTQQLVLLATEALGDGCLGEGAGAAVMAQVAQEAAPSLRAQLLRVAQEEQRHAELSWSLLEFCLTAGGATVRHAVERTLAGLSHETSVPAPPAGREALWRAHGRPTPALVQKCYRQTLLAVRQRTAELLTRLAGSVEHAAA